MRISTGMLQQQGTNAILQRQSELSRTQLQLATGRRILSPADDPGGAAAVLDLNQSIELLDQ